MCTLGSDVLLQKKSLCTFHGALWVPRVNHHLQIHYITVPVLTLMSLGHFKFPRINNDYFCDTVNTGPYNYSDQYYLDDILWTVKGVVLLARAVPCTLLPGSASLSLHLPVMTWR